MSNISIALDRIRDVVLPALFPSKIEIPKTRDLETNIDKFLQDSWGIRIDGSVNAAYKEFTSTAEGVAMTIILSKEAFTEAASANKRFVVEKSLLEDSVTLRKEMINHDRLGISNNILDITYDGNNGIQSIYGEKFLYIENSFIIEIKEIE